MKRIVDLRSQNTITIDSCDKEPIHIPGSIQPHGYLLATDTNLVITHCSANVEQFLELPTTAVLSQPLHTIFEAQYLSIKEFLENEQNQTGSTLLVEHHGQYFYLSSYKSESRYVLEFEEAENLSDGLSTATVEVNELLALSQKPEGVQSLCQAMAIYVKEKLGYDRVMIYRFHDDYSGEVFAECITDDLSPFLGLRYPSGDIPLQARELYLRNLIRSIPDINYEPVSLLTYSDNEEKVHQLDLSDSSLRSVSPIHIQYLKNMKVAASFSVSIVKDKKLWGLIACHHNSPKYLTPSQRQAARLYGVLLSSQLEVHERAEALNLVTAVDKALDGLLKLLQNESLNIDHLINSEYLKEISGATGIIMRVEGVLYKAGQTPTEAEIKQLAGFLYSHSANKTLVTQQISSIFPATDSYASLCSGIIYHPLGQGTSDFVLWIKPGLDQTVIWAGNPEKNRLSPAEQLTPRTSFDAWKQKTRNISSQWYSYQINATLLFVSALQRQLHLMYLQKEEEKQRLLAEKLKETNTELENINWISAHDLKEPLRKIRVLTSRLMRMEQNELTASISDGLIKINQSAQKMQLLIDDIMNFARISAKEQLFSYIELQTILNEVIENFSEEIESTKATVYVDLLPCIHASPFQIKQLFQNLIGNALKFSRPDSSLELRIIHEKTKVLLKSDKDTLPGSFLLIQVQDNGKGFDELYKDRVFKLFQRLDSSVQGTGMGLAICKKIMDNHQGVIDVESKPGQGSTFKLYFPGTLLLENE